MNKGSSMSDAPRGMGRLAGIVAVLTTCSLTAAMPHGVAADRDPLAVTNVRVTERQAATATLTFDVTWKDSWRHEGNHDAMWVFFKYRPKGADDWRHVRLAADRTLNPTGYGQAEGTRVDLIVPDGDDGYLGMLVRRAEYGLGTVEAQGVTARWDLRSARGVPPDHDVALLAFGIEMAFIPEGSYLLGDGGTQTFHFYQYTDGSQHHKPYRVAAAGAIQTGRQPGRLWARGNEPEDGGQIPAAYPTGYGAFYAAKRHAMSLYPAFAARLSEDEKQTFNRWQSNQYSGSWPDGAAFAAWAALRPLSELEYEKLTRGPTEPGWNTGDSLDHPSFWGVHNINGWRVPREQTVTVANAAGRRFRGTHGGGTTTLPADWPQQDAVGAGVRGGYNTAGDPSCRADAATGAATPRNGLGWRAARTAPKGVGL
jgi:hypothetical protein